MMHVDDDASLVDDVQELVREIVESELTEHAIQSSDVEDCQSRSPAGIRGSTYSSLFSSLLPAKQHTLIMNPEVDSASVSVLFAAQHREKENRAGF